MREMREDLRGEFRFEINTLVGRDEFGAAISELREQLVSKGEFRAGLGDLRDQLF